MSGDSSSLRSLFESAEDQRRRLEQLPSTNADVYQDAVRSALTDYQKCLETADQVALFSPNETIDDVTSNDIQYFLLHYRVAELTLKRIGSDRRGDLKKAQASLCAFLKQIDSYEILERVDAKLLERLLEAPDNFSIVTGTDPAAKREVKIRRFKEEKELRQRLEFLRSSSAASQDEEMTRTLHLQHVQYGVHQAFQMLESIVQELHILALAPPPRPEPDLNGTLDERDRERQGDGYSDRLDGPMSAGLKGALLDAKGRPMRPFTLLDKRQELQAGVFRPDHSLPTMTIDEYLDEEMRRGGIIEGGGEKSGMRPEPDEDDFEKADAETMKARAWDDFTEENPKGAGNRLNRG
ncbi:hypothetical protein CAC42_5387 [Sphaceloma murrayae]|uniref:Type 2A phosphatase-associated protein 42 n=1 Tax=Sphaceloma murrayae TaxID=2082308 RepID=A0A2K1QUW0_9PEZI|nr:hypothetical protein CAC42_5387 [Sphaceloma murrayae]